MHLDKNSITTYKMQILNDQFHFLNLINLSAKKLFANKPCCSNKQNEQSAHSLRFSEKTGKLCAGMFFCFRAVYLATLSSHLIIESITSIESEQAIANTIQQAQSGTDV